MSRVPDSTAILEPRYHKAKGGARVAGIGLLVLQLMSRRKLKGAAPQVSRPLCRCAACEVQADRTSHTRHRLYIFLEINVDIDTNNNMY